MKYFGCLWVILLLGCSSNNKSIKVKGSDTEVNLAVQLAENFYKVNANFSIAISGGGSGLGIASLLNGQADVANSSRPLNEEEINLFKARKIELYMLSTQHQTIEEVRPLAYGTALVLIIVVFLLNLTAFYIRYKHSKNE